MKIACLLVLCLAVIASAFEEDQLEDRILRSSSKELPGGYTFVTTPIGGGKYSCECYRHGKRVWAGMCGVKDKSFSYNDCA